MLSSGGVRGVALATAVGVLGAADRLREVRTVIGTSAGSVVGMLVALDYTPTEVMRLARDVDLVQGLSARHTATGRPQPRVGLADIAPSHEPRARRHGDGARTDTAHADRADVASRTGRPTSRSATSTSGPSPPRDLRDGSRDRVATYFSPDDTPDVPIEFAVRAVRLPFVFRPVDGRYVDGALVDHYPIGQSRRPRADAGRARRRRRRRRPNL